MEGLNNLQLSDPAFCLTILPMPSLKTIQLLIQISVNKLQTSEIWVEKTVPWPLKRSEPVVKYRKKDQRNFKKNTA